MSKFLKFRSLPSKDRLFFIKAFSLLLAVRFALFIIPFQVFRRFLNHVFQVSKNPSYHEEAVLDKMSWLLRVAGRYVPGSEKCLSEALVTQVLLRQEGFHTLLKIGVTKSEKGKLHAHAWVESQDRIVIGGKNISEYTPLLTFSTPHPNPLPSGERAG